MRKIIDGKLYDTGTATLVGSDSYSNARDFAHWSEELYRKRTGEFFLYGEGGPMSKYSKVCGQNEWCGGERIIPITEESAKAWAENHMSADEYIAVFGDVEE